MAHEVKHPRWGSNLANQLSAKMRSKTEWRNVEEEYRSWWFRKKKTRIVTEPVYSPCIDAGDNDGAHRRFRHRCGLIKLVLVQERFDRPKFLTFFDGHVITAVDVQNIEFRFAPEELVRNGGGPIADITFYGWGTRRGPFSSGYGSGTEALTCTFASKKQMNQYIDTRNFWLADDPSRRSLTDVLERLGN